MDLIFQIIIIIIIIIIIDHFALIVTVFNYKTSRPRFVSGNINMNIFLHEFGVQLCPTTPLQLFNYFTKKYFVE